jgi:hypothetical protein
VPAALGDLRDRGIDGKFLAVGAQPRDDALVAHAPGRGAGLAELLHVPVVRGAETLRDEALQGRTQRLGLRDAEHLLGCRVEEDDLVRLVDGDDRVHGRLEDSPGQGGMSHSRSGMA